MNSGRLTTRSSKETEALAKSLAKEVIKKKPAKGALVIGLIGDLGAGKTTFIKSFIRAVGIKKRVTSPTFLILRRFRMPRNENFQNIFHVDAYRIEKKEDLKEVGMDEVLSNPRNIVLIEWADNIKSVLPKKLIWVKFKHGRERNERHITIN